MNSKRFFYSILFFLVIAAPIFAGDPPPQLVISDAQVDFVNGRIAIHGRNFGSDVPTVKLAGQLVTVSSASDTSIDATLPAGIAPGTYVLNVSRGTATTQSDVFDLTLGAVGPKGDKGDQGLPGAKGDKGDKGDTGATGAPGAKGDTGAPGAPGQDGTIIPRGLVEFRDPGSYSFTVPDGVHRIQVELWGAGGGGGEEGVAGDMGTRQELGGGGGGGGAYYRAIVNVTSGTNVSVTVGAGGTAGGRTPGGDSAFGQLVAHGGQGGTTAGCDASPAKGGTPTIGTDISRPGNDGSAGECTFTGRPQGGKGGAALPGTLNPPAPNGMGADGGPHLTPDHKGREDAKYIGGNGYVLITW